MRKITFDILVNGMDNINLDKNIKSIHKTLINDNLNNILFSKFNNTKFNYKIKNKNRMNKLKEILESSYLYKNVPKDKNEVTTLSSFKRNEDRLEQEDNLFTYQNTYSSTRTINLNTPFGSNGNLQKDNAVESFKRYNEISKDNLFKDNDIYLEKESIRLKNVSIFIEDNKIKDIELTLLKSINSDFTLFFLNESLKVFEELFCNNEIELSKELVSFYLYFKKGSLLEFDKFKNFHINSIIERKYDYLLDIIEKEIKDKFPLLEKFKDNFKFENDSIFHSYNYLDLILGNKKINALIPSFSSIEDVKDKYSLLNLNKLNLMDVNNSSFRFTLNDTYLFNKSLDKNFALNEENVFTVNKNIGGGITVTSNNFLNSWSSITPNNFLDNSYTIKFDNKIFKTEKEKVLIETINLEDFINNYNKTNIYNLFEIVMKVIRENFESIISNKKMHEKIKEAYYLDLKVIEDNIESTLKRNYFNDTIDDIKYTYKNLNNEKVTSNTSFFKDFYEMIYDLDYINKVEDFKNKINYFYETLEKKFKDITSLESYFIDDDYNVRIDNENDLKYLNILNSNLDLLNIKCEILNSFLVQFIFNIGNFSSRNASFERYLDKDVLNELINNILKDNTSPFNFKMRKIFQTFILNYIKNKSLIKFSFNNNLENDNKFFKIVDSFYNFMISIYENEISDDIKSTLLFKVKNYFSFNNLKIIKEIDLLKDFIANLVKDIYKDIDDESINNIQRLFIYGFSNYIEKVRTINGFLEMYDRSNVTYNTDLREFSNYRYTTRLNDYDGDLFQLNNNDLIDQNFVQANNFAFAN